MKTISTEELQKIINSKQSYIIIDVREKEELKYGIIPTSVHLPLSSFTDIVELSEDEFKSKYTFSKPTKHDNIILYCRTGFRSAQATTFLMKKDFNVRNYKGSILEWSAVDPSVKMY